MSDNAPRHQDDSTDSSQRVITLNLHCHGDGTERPFCVSAESPISEFLEQVLEELAQGEGAERVRLLRDNYQPVLELLADGSSIELPGSQTLAEANIPDNAQIQIAARPLKEKLLFCRYSEQA